MLFRRKKKEEEENNRNQAAGQQESAADGAEQAAAQQETAAEGGDQAAASKETAAEGGDRAAASEETAAESEEQAAAPSESASEGAGKEQEPAPRETGQEAREPVPQKTEQPVQESPDTKSEPEEAREQDGEPEGEEQPKKKKRNFFGALADRLNAAFGATEVTEEVFDEIEEIFITSDIGMDTTESLMQQLRLKVFQDNVKKPEEAKKIVADIMASMMDKGDRNRITDETPLIILMVGINGGGKTTTIGKLGNRFLKEGKSVMFVAGDTFRAAAGEQLRIWADRIGVPIVQGTEGADPSAVLFDGLASARSRGTDVIICDTAGRLQNKKNLMEELSKMDRVIDRQYPEASRETLLVLDATTGKNALSQVEQFNEAADLSGVIITKLDGTAKGGIAITIADQYDMPIKFIGVGEGIDDLEPFDAKRFVGGIFDE